jgi:hypothetical protein
MPATFAILDLRWTKRYEKKPFALKDRESYSAGAKTFGRRCRFGFGFGFGFCAANGQGFDEPSSVNISLKSRARILLTRQLAPDFVHLERFELLAPL